MAAANDPQGHYHALGLAPNASRAQISHAYREWAKAFHPDVSGSTDAGDFHRIKEAYDTLSDEARRRRYDAAGWRRPSDDTPPDAADFHTQAASGEAAHPPAEAIRCSVCNAISAQPRFCIFYRVVSAIVYCRMDRLDGIYCRRCAAKKALRASAISWLAGWWGITGIFQTPIALWRNLCLGSKPNQPNARLLIAQARYFLSIKNETLANACLRQAARFAGEDDAEILFTLRQSLRNDDTRTIRDEWTIYRHPDVLRHALPVILLASIVLSQTIGARHGIRSAAPALAASAARSVDIAPSPMMLPTHSDDIRHVAIGSATIWIVANGRYVGGGFLPQFTTVEVLGLSRNPDFVTARLPDGRSATLAASALAPGSGAAAKLLWCDDPAQKPPYNGEIFKINQSGPHRAVVTNTGGDEAVVKFRDLAGTDVVALFVDGHSEAVIDDFPDGLFRIEFATGMHWNRKCGFFEQGMDTQRLSKVDTFASWQGTEIIQGKHVTVAHSRIANYTIPPPSDADVQQEPIDQEAFMRE